MTFHPRSRTTSGRRRGSGPLLLAMLLGAGGTAAPRPAPASQLQEVVIEASGTALAEERLDALLRRPIDDPGHLALLLELPPAEVAAAALALGEARGDRIGPLHIILHGLAALLSRAEGPYRQQFDDTLAALDRVFFPPDLLGATDRIVEELDEERVNIHERASLYEKTGGLPLPRKKQMDSSTGELSPYDYERLAAERRTLVANEEQLAQLRARYPVLMAEMGHYYGRHSNLTLAYECFSRAIRMDWEMWKANQDRYRETYLAAASFMVLSAHRSDDVLALYAVAPLDPEPLQRRVVEQIEARTNIYARAADEYTNHASVNQALRDLLYTLIEDEGAIEFLPPKDRERFLREIGDTSMAKRHYQEAIGVYATLDDRKKLISLGKKLSKHIYTSRRGQAYINRDLAWAVDAFREAAADKEMESLLEKIQEAQVEIKEGQLTPDDPVLLDTFARKLDAYLYGAEAEKVEVLSGARPEDVLSAPTPAPTASEVPEADLPGLIQDYVGQLRAAVPGQDMAYLQSRLSPLADQAEASGKLDLAVSAWSVLGPEGWARMEILAVDLIAKRRYEDAYRYLELFRPTSDEVLAEMSAAIIQEGIAPRGVFNPAVVTAVTILVELDAVDAVEQALNEMYKLRVQFAQLQNQAEISGRAIANRNLSQLEEAIRIIETAYDIVGSGPAVPPPDAPAPPAPSPAP